VVGVLVAAHLELPRADEAPEAPLPAVAVGHLTPVTRCARWMCARRPVVVGHVAPGPVALVNARTTPSSLPQAPEVPEASTLTARSG